MTEAMETPNDETTADADALCRLAAAGYVADGTGWQVECADALDALRALPDGCADAIITDPPYCSGGFTEAQRKSAKGQGLRSETLRVSGWFEGDNMGTAGLVWLLRSIAFESCRVLTPGGSLSIFTDWRMVSALQPAIEAAGLRFQSLVVWDKQTPGLGWGFRAQHEIVLHFAPGKPEYHDKSTGNVLRVPRKRWEHHQTEKPVDLMRRIVRVCAPPGGVVLDPFTGSGSTGVAALREGRAFLGFERDPDHAETARQRLAAERAAPSLFQAT